MTHMTIPIGGTQANAALVLGRVVRSPLMIGACLLLLMPFLWLAFHGETLTLAVAAVVIYFPLFVVRQFAADLYDGAGHGTAADALDASLVAASGSQKFISAGDLFAAACRERRGAFLLRQMAMDPEHVIGQCAEAVDDTLAIDVMVDELRSDSPVTAPRVLVYAFARVPQCIATLQGADLSAEDMHILLQWELFHEELLHYPRWWEPEGILRSGSVGRSWVMGYTDALDHLTTDIAEGAHVSGEHAVVIHRERINDVLHVLRRSDHHNVLILGKVGTGKRTLIRNMAAILRQQERDRHQSFTRVLQLDTPLLLSGVRNPDTFFLEALNRARSGGRFVLVIRDLGLLLQSGEQTIKGVLLKFLEAKGISVIGVADPQEYHALIKCNPMLDAQFEKIALNDAADEDTLHVLMARAFAARHARVTVTYKAIKSVIELCKRYLTSRGGMPGIAIGVLDDAVQRAAHRGDHMVGEEHVREAVTLKSNINVQSVTQNERDRLLNLEEALRQKVIGQDKSASALVRSLKRALLDLRERKRPIGTFLFLGPTGVGKTQMAKELAAQYFGGYDALIRLDMNEFGHPDSVFGITGSPSGSDEGFLAKRIQDKPFSLVLLDEIEKAHPSVLHLFLQILDEGMLTDNRGMRTDFRNTIIIATSNAGALFIRDFVANHPQIDDQEFKRSLLDAIIREQKFSPEFLNRFDDVILFYPLARESAARIARLMLDDIVRDVQSRRGIAVTIDDDVLQGLVERGHSVEFGAREMRRTITEMVEDYLADYLLHHDVQRGDTIAIHRSDVKW